MTELYYWSALDTLQAYRDKKVSPVEVVRAVIDRIDAVGGEVNAFTEHIFDEALAQAKEAEGRYRRGRPEGVLDGLPVAVKDEHDMVGRASTDGSLLLEGMVADQDHPVVERLLGARAVVHG